MPTTREHRFATHAWLEFRGSNGTWLPILAVDISRGGFGLIVFGDEGCRPAVGEQIELRAPSTATPAVRGVVRWRNDVDASTVRLGVQKTS
jgi:hypothetical protein